MHHDDDVSISPKDYFKARTGDSIRAIAQRAGVTQSTLNRQLVGTTDLTVHTVVAICRAYDLELAPAFIACGFITEPEARTFNRSASLREVSEEELLKELLRRTAEGQASALLTDPIDSKLLDDVLGEVEDARVEGRQSDYDVAADARKDRTPGEQEHDDDNGPQL